MVEDKLNDTILEFSLEDIEDIFKTATNRLPTSQELQAIENHISLDPVWDTAYNILKTQIQRAIYELDLK